MKFRWWILAVAVSVASAAAQVPPRTDVISEVRAAIAASDLNRAEAVFARHRAAEGATPEVLEALSWLGRGALAAGQLDRANRHAGEAQQLAVKALGSRKMADDHLAIALGAGIEVQAQVAARQGQRSEAIGFLQGELTKYAGTPIHLRIQKNINLLTLEGHPAPPLDISEFIGPAPQTLAQLKGKVLVMFFWAHWCPDCKMAGPILRRLLDKYQAQGLTIVAPTQRYGYGEGGAPLGRDEELRYIVRIRDQYYPFLATLSVPTSQANHALYGVSSTPTMVIADRQGIIRVYRPGTMTETDLEAQIRPLLAQGAGSAGN